MEQTMNSSICIESTKNDAVNNDDNGIAQEDASYTETDDGIIKR